jgi:hypothetical protein
VKPLQIKTLTFSESELLEWKRGNYEMLTRSKASPFLKRILIEKARRRPGRRFFGEAFVATRIEHERGWYGSFKWLTSSATGTSAHAKEYRAALLESFPAVSNLPSRASILRELLQNKKPVPPDLWLVVNGAHQFIEVKLPQDSIRLTQIAGLALIATCLSSAKNISVWIYSLSPEGSQPSPIPTNIQAMYQRFCSTCSRRSR